MKEFFEKLNRVNRQEFFKRIIMLLIVLLLLQLFRITIINGKKYRELADSRRVKEVMITAQRGNIRDRNGIILAGNRPVFTVQLRKDELAKVDREKKNNNFLKLVRYLEEDGVKYLDEFPMELNTFTYRDKKDNNLSLDATSQVVNYLLEPNILKDFLLSSFKKPYKSHYDYSLAKDLYKALKISQEESSMELKSGTFVYTDDNKSQDFKKVHGLATDTGAQEDVIKLLIENPTSIKMILDNPIARLKAYELLEKKGLNDKIALRPISNLYFDRYEKQKMTLMELDSNITWDSTAKDDFYTLLRKFSLENLLLARREKDQKRSNLEMALESIEDKKISSNLKIKNEGKSQEIIQKNGESGLGLLLNTFKDDRVLEKFLSMEDMRTRAQAQLINDGINPGISVGTGEYKYTQLKNAEDLFKRYSLDMKEGNRKLFDQMTKKHGIKDELSNYEKRSILNLYNSVEKQGNYAYIPVNFAYEVSDLTVARIEENLPVNMGIQISIEPIRSYPLGQSASHVLGYIGNIAMEEEINKYVKDLGYDRNTLIGKTGIEEVKEIDLKGTNGYRKVTVDSLGNTTDTIEEIAPVPGKDVQLTIDIDLQQKAEEILEKSLAEIRSGGIFESPWGSYNYITSKDKGRPYNQATSGAVVVVDVNDGGVLAMANYPQYDPNLFAKGINSMDWESLKPEHEKDLLAPRPLYNISMQSAVQPGSIFKMVTGLAALEKGLDPSLKIQDGGFVDLGGHRFGCWLWNQKREVHGKEDLANAIKDSCNYYFYTLALGQDQKTGQDLGMQVGAQDISTMAKKFGLGEKTGLEINIPQEVRGTRPDPAAKTKVLKSLLLNHLDKNLDSYYMGKDKLTPKKEKELKHKILSTLGNKKEMTRSEVYTFLQELEVNPEAYSKKERMQFVDILKYTYIDQAKWKLADTMNVTIGQGSNSYTPVQLARYTMALANGGNLYDLHLIQEVINPLNKWKKEDFKPKNHQVEISDPNFFLEIRKGMKLVAQSGANKNLFENFPVDVAMKTGSAERSGTNPYTNDTYDSFAWEVAYAPAEDPEIAVCVVLFQGGTGANAGPIMQTVLAEYFGLNKDFVEEKLPIETSIDF